jgi:hypothetical protein
MRCGRLEARWRGVAWGVALMVACVLMVLVWRDRRPAAEAPGSPITPSIRAAPIRPSTLVPQSAAPKPVAAAASSAAVMRNRSLMCGQPDEAGSPITGSQINAQLEAGANAGLRRVIPSLQRSNDPIDRMMGALLAEQVPELAPGSHSAEEAMTVFVQQGRDAANGRVLAVAAMHCHRLSAPPAPGSPCALIDLSSWAEKDTGNAAPWLMLARRAHAGGDEAAFDDAMQHAAAAQRFDYGSLELLRLLDHAAVRRLPPSIRVPTMMALARRGCRGPRRAMRRCRPGARRAWKTRTALPPVPTWLTCSCTAARRCSTWPWACASRRLRAGQPKKWRKNKPAAKPSRPP